MSKELRIPFTQVYIGRYLFLLVSILLIFLVVPFLDVYVKRKVLIDVIISMVLISGIYSFSRNRRQFIIGSFIALTALTLGWIAYFEMIASVNIARNICAVVFFAYATIVILFNMFAEKEVTFDVINGAVCVYLLLGLMWAFAYALLESIQPGSFQFGEAKSLSIQNFIYHSFVTQSTLGYGDITPATDQARSLAILEAVVGQLYIAVLIARLVGIHISQSSR